MLSGATCDRWYALSVCLNSPADSEMSDSSPTSSSALPRISCILQCMRFRDERAANHASQRWRLAGCADLKFKSYPLQAVRKVMEWIGSLSSGDRCWTPPAPHNAINLHSHAKIVQFNSITENFKLHLLPCNASQLASFDCKMFSIRNSTEILDPVHRICNGAPSKSCSVCVCGGGGVYELQS